MTLMGQLSCRDAFALLSKLNTAPEGSDAWSPPLKNISVSARQEGFPNIFHTFQRFQEKDSGRLAPGYPLSLAVLCIRIRTDRRHFAGSGSVSVSTQVYGQTFFFSRKFQFGVQNTEIMTLTKLMREIKQCKLALVGI
jgi:hypothetical protein